MTNVIKFPRQARVAEEVSKKTVEPTKKPSVSGIGVAVLRGVWVVTVLCWPILKWILALDCVYQAARMLYYWNTPGVHAGWTFALHFAVLTALTYFVSVYKPKSF